MSTHVFGSYRPAYWRIKMHTKSDLSNVLKLSQEEKATYFHEYTHFIQDISSTFGLNYSWSTLDRLRQIVKSMQKTKEEDLHLPLKSDIVETQIKFAQGFQPVWGDYLLDHDDGSYTVKSLSLPTDKLLAELTGSRIAKLVLCLENREGRKREYIFGADALNESMAQMIQAKFSTDQLSDQFPYVAATRLAEYVYPTIAKNGEYLFAACDFASLSPFPGWHFYILLLELKMREHKIEKAEDIYSFGFELFMERGWDFLREYTKAKDSLIYRNQ